MIVCVVHVVVWLQLSGGLCWCFGEWGKRDPFPFPPLCWSEVPQEECPGHQHSPVVERCFWYASSAPDPSFVHTSMSRLALAMQSLELGCGSRFGAQANVSIVFSALPPAALKGDEGNGSPNKVLRVESSSCACDDGSLATLGKRLVTYSCV